MLEIHQHWCSLASFSIKHQQAPGTYPGYPDNPNMKGFPFCANSVDWCDLMFGYEVLSYSYGEPLLTRLTSCSGQTFLWAVSGHIQLLSNFFGPFCCKIEAPSWDLHQIWRSFAIRLHIPKMWTTATWNRKCKRLYYCIVCTVFCCSGCKSQNHPQH